MLQVDTLVTDLIFQGNASLDQKSLIAGLGGDEALAGKKMLDPDMLDPRAEMELSPSMPFRRRGERRLLMIEDAAAPLRQDPNDPIIPVDLRPYKEALVAMAQKLPVRLGRLFSLGTWGDAVIVARNARDLRGIALISWALDPQWDVDGKRRQSRLGQQEFEAKILAYEKRLEELDEQDILDGLSVATFERRGELLVVDVLEPDGTWDQRKSMLLEQQLAAVERFSLIPGAPAAKKPDGARRADTQGGPHRDASAPAGKAAPAAAAAPAAKPEPPPEPKGPPLAAKELGDRLVIVFPPERFDLDVAAALGKGDWDAVIRRSDKLSGATRDKIHRQGAAWVAPLEFLSEVFVDGKPLTRTAFDQDATQVKDGVRALQVHFPRFGPVTLVDVAGKGRFVSTLGADAADRVAELVVP